ncbi:MAG TPA: hypothetical protein VJ438_01070 [Candidatus Nanoarchaeia archaeon]|nr:hypothetical protein [Candidatus Nanoarchaeia archaeon]
MRSEMEKPKIASDIDDVWVPFMETYLKFHNKMHNTNYKLEDVSNYHLWKCGIHNSREESVKEVLDFQKSIYFDELQLIKGAKEILEKLLKKYQIPFITSRPEEIKEKTESLFKGYFPKNGFNILYSGEIYGGKLSKAEICKINNIPRIIEDNPDYALDCAKNEIKVFLLNKPWNKNYEKHKNIIVVKNLEEVFERLK